MSNYQKRLAAYAEQLHDQIYLLQSDRGDRFARSMGLTVSQALAMTALELSKLLNQ